MRQERMVVARRMLAGGRSPDEVGESLGFAVRSTFRREFLQFYQVRPVVFQQERWELNFESYSAGAAEGGL